MEGGKRDRQKNTTGVCACGKKRQTEIHNLSVCGKEIQTEIHNWSVCGKEIQTEEHDCGKTGGWSEKQNGRHTVGARLNEFQFKRS